MNTLTGKQAVTRRQRAITLIELLISLFIGVVVIGALLGLVNYTTTLQETTRNKVRAMDAARQRIEQLKSDVQFDYPGTINNLINNPVFTPVGLANARGRITMTPLNAAGIRDGVANLYDVRVVICWRQGNGRVIGEDANLNGIFDFGEDTNNNAVFDSPCTLTTAIRRAS